MASLSGKSKSVNRAFERCLENRKIFPAPHAKSLARKELSAAEQDLAEAKDRLGNERDYSGSSSETTALLCVQNAAEFLEQTWLILRREVRM